MDSLGLLCNQRRILREDADLVKNGKRRDLFPGKTPETLPHLVSEFDKREFRYFSLTIELRL